MSWPKEHFRIVKAFEEPLGNPTLVVVRSHEELQRLDVALQEFVREAEGDEPMPLISLAEWLEEKGFTVPLSYSTEWPFDKGIGG